MVLQKQLNLKDKRMKGTAMQGYAALQCEGGFFLLLYKDLPNQHQQLQLSAFLCPKTFGFSLFPFPTHLRPKEVIHQIERSLDWNLESLGSFILALYSGT